MKRNPDRQPLPLMNEAEAAEFLGLSRRFLQSRRYRRDGPPFVRISCRAVRYRPEDLSRWIEGLRQPPQEVENNGC